MALGRGGWRKTLPASSEGSPERFARFLAAHGWAGADCRPLAADASFRSYHRVRLDGRGAVLMDAPPDKEKPAAFRQIAELLQGLALSPPAILAADLERGLLLLEDLGDETFTRALAKGAEEAALYRLATDVLIALHRRWRPELGGGLPHYDEGRLLEETLLLVDWAWPALKGTPAPAAARESYLAAWRAVLPAAEAVPPTLVLRDFHVDNLMVLPGREGIAACGLLDFQDAVLGAPAYDLVSLLRDARRDVPTALAETMLDRYLAAFPTLDDEAFGRAYWTLGAQRNAKIIGIFTRLSRRDGKHGYLRHLPRVWCLLEAELAHPFLTPVRGWFDQHFPPPLRRAPEQGEQA